MIGVVSHDFYTGRNYEDVFVLFPDGTAQTFAYTPISEGPEPTPAPSPGGLHTPTGNFGRVWFANQQLRERIGHATAPAEVLAVDQSGQGGGVVQFFEGGLMVYPNFSAEKIYVLYHVSGDRHIVRSPHLTLTDIIRWSVYDDTYRP
jgi:hypothetical protein